MKHSMRHEDCLATGQRGHRELLLNNTADPSAYTTRRKGLGQATFKDPLHRWDLTVPVQRAGLQLVLEAYGGSLTLALVLALWCELSRRAAP